MEKLPKMGPSSSIFVDRIFHEKNKHFGGTPISGKSVKIPYV
jgi:hypothetical protein